MPENLKDKRILVVDDNATNRYVLGGTLKTLGCRFAEAADGGEALERLHGALSDEDPFEIAILDMTMPQMDGETLGRKIKEDPELTGTILVMLTSAGQRGDTVRLKKSGFEAYLTKPIKRTQLFDCLATVVGQKKGDEAIPKRRMVTRHSIAEDRKHGTRILLAEDNVTNQKVALHMLKKFGYSADVVANGKEAVKALKSIPYDLVLMDVQMPVMDGFEATKAIRNLEVNGSTTHPVNRLPIIAMTANAMKGDRERCLEAGMDDYISKPADPQQLLDKVRFWSRDSKKKDSDRLNTVKEPAMLPGETKESVPIDLDRALERAMGDKEFLKDILQQFIADLPQQLEVLETAVSNTDAEALAKQAHTLKGASANLAADEMSAEALKLELMGKDGNLGGARQTLAVLGKELERLREFVIDT